MRTVLKNLVDGLSEAWVRVGQYWRVPCKSSITEARQRMGFQVMSRLFHIVVRPLATVETPGAFLRGLRVMAVDGTVFDVPDTEANARVFGYPATRPGTQAAFPKVRLVLLIEAGTHLIVDALMCPYRMGERVRVKKLLRSVMQGMLLMWDRGLHSYAMVKATLAQKCDYLGRVPKNVKFPVEEVLEDGSYLSWIAPDAKSKKKGALHNGRMKCIHCASSKISKNGHRRGKQCYICRGCDHQFLEVYDTNGYRDSIKEHCLKLYVNGMVFRAIERSTGINHNTVINWVKQAGSSLPNAPELEEIPEVTQVDELETFIGKKKQDMAMDRCK